ncbi:MAG TPA: glycosyltransferase family 4 protein [Reyranella sp.]|jgi:glycosyltransferase involved in cell wall biosynthesis
MARHINWAVPGDIQTVTGGYAYDRRVIAELERLGWKVELVGLGDGFPRPTIQQKAFAQARLLATAPDRPIVIDGLAFGALPDAATALHRTHPVIALVHHPLALETGLMAHESKALLASERAALASTRHVITTSPWTADVLTERFGVARERMTVILPGTDRAPFAAGNNTPLCLLSVGAIGVRKSFDLLVEALAPLTDRPWRLVIAGDRTRDPAATARLDGLIAQHRVGERIDVPGTVSPDQLEALYAGADLFVLTSRFEGYGMAFAEALAHGLPVIGTTGGATPYTVPASAGRLVAPGDIAALTGTLRELIDNDDLRRTLAAGARAAAARLPSWAGSGVAFSDLLTRLT